MFCTRLAANTGRKKVAKNRHLGTIAQLCRAISSQLRHVSTIGKKLVKQQYLLGPAVWGTPARWALAHISSSSFFPRLISAVADWTSTIFRHMVCLSANLECRSEMCCTRIAGNTGRKNYARNRHLRTIA